ncbi:MAG: 3',5'-cyclic adenosine monophosphate phosphodiesterase CpdA [Candidatus Woesearchaeota archaeon]|nr:3',5'-cyclic adenosine monophosphate phosphodiesterase CpdA [Candidatus Woesearchaeota archaeon]
MRILCFVDLHGDFGAIKKLKNKSKRADLLVCAGDITRFETDIDHILQKINNIGKKTLMIHGNHECSDFLKEKCENYPNIYFFHKKAQFINNILFMGFGGGGFEQSCPEMEEFFKKHKNLLNNAKKKVFITHAPPFKTNLDVLGKDYHGNNTLKNLIIKFQPNFAISGHFHENWGKFDTIGMCKVLNPGQKGRFFEI